METAVNGSGGELKREAIVDTNNQWTCPECTTVNTVTEVDGDVTVTMNACSECGAVRPEVEEPVIDAAEEIIDAAFRGDITVDEIKAGLQNLSGGIATAQDVENAARAGEGLPPLEAAGLLDFGPFNSDAALKAIFEKSAEVRVLQADFDRKKDAAKDAKGELDIAAKALVNIIESLKNRRTQALNPSQPYLLEVSEDPLAAPSSSCPWEREHPGQTCPICTQADAKLINVDVNSEVHPEHAGHAEIAEAARVKNVLEPLVEALSAIDVFIEVAELQGLPTEDLNALTAYAEEPTLMPPQILARCCIADPHGSLVQVCRSCGMSLIAETELSTNEGWFPVGALVGLDCQSFIEREAAPAASESEVPPKPEPTRTIKARGSKKRAKKEPEVERKAQTDEGRQRGRAIPKSESARRGNGKAKAAKKRGARK